MEFNKLSYRLRIFIIACILLGVILGVASVCFFAPAVVSFPPHRLLETVIATLLLILLFYLMKSFTLPWKDGVALNCASVVITSAFFICGPAMLVPLIAGGVIHGISKCEKIWSIALNSSVDMIRIVPGAFFVMAAGASLPFMSLTPCILGVSVLFILWFVGSDLLILHLFTSLGTQKQIQGTKPELTPPLLDLLFFPLSLITVLIYSNLGLPYIVLIAIPAMGALYVYRYSVGKKAENEELRRLNSELKILGEEKTALLEEMELRSNELKQAHAYLLHSEKLASLGKLAAGVAHELNTPLGSILTNSEFALSFADDDDMKESLQSIKKATLRCRTITQRLLAYSRKEDLKITSFPLVEVIRTVIKDLEPLIEEHHIVVEDQCEPGFLVRSVFDDLVQILSNLVKNSIDAIAAGNSEKGVITFTPEVVGEHVKISVKDNGTGMEKEVMERIFDPFFTTRDVGKGTGLGLWMCKTIVQRLRGKIHFRSRAGEGSEFIIEIPRWDKHVEALKGAVNEEDTGN